MSHPLWYTRRMKNMRNKIPTTTEMNLAAVKLCATLPKAENLFRLLEHANGRNLLPRNWTDELEEHFAVFEENREREKEKTEQNDRACVLTGADGENPDDCTTHAHE